MVGTTGDPATPIAWARGPDPGARLRPAHHGRRDEPHVQPLRRSVPRRRAGPVRRAIAAAPAGSALPELSGSAGRSGWPGPEGSGDRSGNLTGRQIRAARARRQDDRNGGARHGGRHRDPADRQRRRSRRRARAPLGPVAAGPLPRGRARRSSAAASAGMRHIGGGALRADLRRRRARRPTAGSTRTSSTSTSATSPSVGFDRDDMTMSPITYDEMRPGCYEPKARARRHGHELGRGVAVASRPSRASAARRSSRPRTASSRQACVYAYNDWMVEEWCGDSGGRLIPLTLIPLWDAELAAAEVRRNADAGRARGVLQRDPAAPRAAEHPHRRTGTRSSPRARRRTTVVCMHIGSISKMPATSADAPVAVAATLSFGNAMASLSDFLFSGVLVRFPELKLAYSEGQIGWIPYILERADDVWREHRAWGGVKDHRPRAAVDLLLPPGLRLLLPRRARARVARPGRRRQHRRSRPTTRTPTRRGPHTKELAAAMMADLPAGRRRQDLPRQRDPHARPRSL